MFVFKIWAGQIVPTQTLTEISTINRNLSLPHGSMKPAVWTCCTFPPAGFLQHVGQWGHTATPQAPELVLCPGNAHELPSGRVAFDGNFPHIKPTSYTHTQTHIQTHSSDGCHVYPGVWPCCSTLQMSQWKKSVFRPKSLQGITLVLVSHSRALKCLCVHAQLCVSADIFACRCFSVCLLLPVPRGWEETSEETAKQVRRQWRKQHWHLFPSVCRAKNPPQKQHRLVLRCPFTKKNNRSFTLCCI